MAHATEERTQNQQGNQPQFKAGQPSPQNKGNQGEAFGNQKDKEMKGNPIRTNDSDETRARSQPTHDAHDQSPPGSDRQKSQA
ncbi:MAG TPA: hypothetical protein VHW46_16705 [Terracidiphilus sp.]|jgi:hypothetical protein|nr:hypothetical protein [Terracidiphilus sp.]